MDYYWDFYADHTYDQRYQPDAVGRQYGTPAVFKVSVYCIWCHDHAFTVDVKAALIFVVTIPLLSVVVFSVMLVSIPLFKKVQRGLDEVLGHTRENLDGARVIRAFNKQEEETKDFNESNAYLTKIQMLVGRISTLMNPLTYVIINFAIIAVIWVGGRQVNIGRISQGEVIALVNYMSQILVELVKLANLIITINKAIACGNRIQEVLEVVPTITDSVTETKEKRIR